MALTPALFAIIAPAAVAAHVGIQGSIAGLLINSVKPKVSAQMEEYRDEATNPDTLIFHTHDLTFTIEADRKSRLADLSIANLGAGLPLASMPFITNGTRFGFPIVDSGDYKAGSFVLTERDDNMARGKLDTATLTLKYWDFALPELAA